MTTFQSQLQRLKLSRSPDKEVLISDQTQARAWQELEGAYNCLSILDRETFQEKATCQQLFEKGPEDTVLNQFVGHLGLFEELKHIPEVELVEALVCIACS